MRKFTVLALTMALCASLLVGCGCSSNMGVTTNPTTAPTAAPTTVPTTVPPTTEAPTTEVTTLPTTTPIPETTQDTTGIMDDFTDPDGSMDADRGTIPQEGTVNGRNRRFR